MASGGQDQAPGQFRRRIRIDPAFAKRDDDAVAGTGVEIKMGSGLTFFLDSRPSRWDPSFVSRADPGRMNPSESYRSLLEFYLKTRDAVDAKYTELTDLGYQSLRAPYETPIGMYFAMINDPDGNTILLSGDLEENEAAKEG